MPYDCNFNLLNLPALGRPLVAAEPPMVLFPNVDVDATSNDSFGRMLYHIRTHANAMYSCHSDGGDYVAKCHVWQQILCRNWDRSVFLVWIVNLTRPHFDVALVVAAQRPDVAVDGVDCGQLVAEPLVQL